MLQLPSLSIQLSSLHVPLKICYLCIIRDSITTLNNPSHNEFGKKQAVSLSSDCPSNLAHRSHILQAPVPYISITLSVCPIVLRTRPTFSDLSYLGFARFF